MPILIAASLLCAVGSRADESPPGNGVDDPHSSEPRVVEVDPERRKIVWQYLSPPVGASRRQPTLVSLRRYSAEWRPPVALELRTRD
jgi:hypothetical protein